VIKSSSKNIHTLHSNTVWNSLPEDVRASTSLQLFRRRLKSELFRIDVINVYNVYKKFFVNAFIILSTFISIKSHEQKEAKLWREAKL